MHQACALSVLSQSRRSSLYPASMQWPVRLAPQKSLAGPMSVLCAAAQSQPLSECDSKALRAKVIQLANASFLISTASMLPVVDLANKLSILAGTPKVLATKL